MKIFVVKCKFDEHVSRLIGDNDPVKAWHMSVIIPRAPCQLEASLQGAQRAITRPITDNDFFFNENNLFSYYFYINKMLKKSSVYQTVIIFFLSTKLKLVASIRNIRND